MSLDLDTFKTNLGNVVRPNRFEVIIQPPAVINISDYIDGTKLVMHVQSASIPDRSFNEIAIKFYGMEYKLPGSEVIQDLTVTFLNDSDWDIRSLFEAWTQLINDRSNGIKGYMKDLFDGVYIIVRQLGTDLDSDGNATMLAGYRFRHVFPKTVDQIELSMEANDTVETFNVTFSYSYWEPEDGYSGTVQADPQG
jgi:hypothetical protein